MNIAEMHVAFRQYAQQMGMQNVRAILPEQIDVLLNQSITDTVNQLIRENIGLTSDRLVSDNSQIGQINALRPLYEVKIISMRDEFNYDPAHKNIGLLTYNLPADFDPSEDETPFGDYLFIVDMSINYINTSLQGNLITPWYPVRIIDSSKLADALNDFVLKNRFRSPIACLYANNAVEIYIEKFLNVASGDFPTFNIKTAGGGTAKLQPNSLRVDIIKRPAKVKYLEDVDSQYSTDCDLPEQMHGDIVKRAVDMYRIAVSGQLQTQQQVTQQPQQQPIQE